MLCVFLSGVCLQSVEIRGNYGGISHVLCILMLLRGVGRGEGYEEIFYISTEEGIEGVIYIEFILGRVRAKWYT